MTRGYLKPGSHFFYLKIEITNVTFDKIQFMINHKEQFNDQDFLNNYDKIIFEDGFIRPSELNVMYFIDNVNHIQLLGNEFLLALMDIPFINRYMAKMSKLKEASQFLTTIKEPSIIDWDANTCWAERVRDVFKGGIIRRTTSENSFEYIEEFYTSNTTTISGNIVTDPELYDDFLLVDITDVEEWY